MRAEVRSRKRIKRWIALSDRSKISFWGRRNIVSTRSKISMIFLRLCRFGTIRIPVFAAF
jgi:hypothetical protein